MSMSGLLTLVNGSGTMGSGVYVDQRRSDRRVPSALGRDSERSGAIKDS